MKKYKNINKMVEYPSSGILSKEILKTEKFDSTLFMMVKGSELSAHTSTREGVVHVLEGKGIFVLEGEEIEMVSGVFVYMKKNAVHSLRAEENTAFVLSLYN
jgi:nitric oxide dioxygenase